MYACIGSSGVNVPPNAFAIMQCFFFISEQRKEGQVCIGTSPVYLCLTHDVLIGSIG